MLLCPKEIPSSTYKSIKLTLNVIDGLNKSTEKQSDIDEGISL